MVLLAVLVHLQERLGLRLHVAHVHHGLRGKAADRDAALVVSAAARFRVATTVERLDPKERPRGMSVEMWARSARYRSLKRIAERVRATHVATAHTQNDQAETVLLNLLRGSGPRGLAGIPGARDGILRPLLGTSRAEVERYAADRRLAFRADASNASEAHRRNRVRRHLLPLLAREYNPRIVESLASLASLMREDDEALAARAASLVAERARGVESAVFLKTGILRAAPPAVARRALLEMFREACRGGHGLTRRHLEAMQRLLTREALVRLPGGLVGQRFGAEVRIGPPIDPAADPSISVQGTQGSEEIRLRPGIWVHWAPLNCRIRVRRLPGGGIPGGRRHRWREVLSPRVLGAHLILRRWRPGDRLRPVGMPGRKKLQDLFVDAKVPRQERGRIPILVAGERIVWVVGYRVAEDFRWCGVGAACLAEVEFPAA
jgi:tRNA(Ile)-lysidine synthase